MSLCQAPKVATIELTFQDKLYDLPRKIILNWVFTMLTNQHGYRPLIHKYIDSIKSE